MPDHDDELPGAAADCSHFSRTCAVPSQLFAQLIDSASPGELGCRSPSNRKKTNVAKSNQKSNREIRKPKSAKPKPTVQASPFDKPQGLGMGKKGGGKKAR